MITFREAFVNEMKDTMNQLIIAIADAIDRGTSYEDDEKVNQIGEKAEKCCEMYQALVNVKPVK